MISPAIRVLKLEEIIVKAFDGKHDQGGAMLERRAD